MKTMMTIRNCGPNNDFDRMSEALERLWSSAPRAASHAMPVDVIERDGELIVRSPAAGVKPENVQVLFEGRTLTIKASHLPAEDEEGAKVYRREIASGEWTRSLRLPENVDGEKIEALFDHGMLTVRIPLIKPEGPQSIQVQVKSPL